MKTFITTLVFTLSLAMSSSFAYNDYEDETGYCTSPCYEDSMGSCVCPKASNGVRG